MFLPDSRSRIRFFSIPNPRFWIQIFSILDPWSRIRIFSIPGPGSRIRIKEFKYFNQKKMVSQLSEKWSGFSITDPYPGSGSWLFTHPRSWSCIPDSKSRGQKGTGALIPDPGSGFATLDIFALLRLRGYHWLLTFNGRCCFNNSFNGSALRSFYMQKRILRICYFNIVSLIFTVFKLWCPAHLFPNTPRTFAHANAEMFFFTLHFNVTRTCRPGSLKSPGFLRGNMVYDKWLHFVYSTVCLDLEGGDPELTVK